MNEEIKIIEKKRGWFDFLIKPTHEISFDGKKADEKVIVFTRRHWFVLLNVIIGGAFAILFPFIIIIFGAPILIKYDLSSIFTLIWSIDTMTVWFYVFYQLTMHSLDTWIVTDERVLDIMQESLFVRKVSELHLSSLQDISVKTNGFIQSYLDFGNLEIQTGATANRFLFEEVPHPLEIKDKIMEYAHDFIINNDKK